MDKILLMNILQSNNIVIPMYLLSKYKELKIELNEFMFLMYLHSMGNKTLFNPMKYSEEMNIELNEVMDLIGKLSDKSFIKIEVLKNDKDVLEEVIVLDGFYEKIGMLLIVDASNKDESHKDESKVYSYIENQFARTLSSIDYEIIRTWFDSNYSEDLIIAAVDETVANGVSSLKYIDKILYDWSKKGIESVSDLENHKKKALSSKKELDDNIDIDMVDWDWLDDEE